MSKKFLKPTLIGALCLMTGIAKADLIEYTYTGKDGNQHTVPANHTHINAVGTIKMTLNAGIDRKLKVSILNQDGSIVSTITSNLLSAEDLINVNGQSTYGTYLELPAPPEGNYTISAQMLGAWGNIIHTDSYPLIVDLTPPLFGGVILSQGHDAYANLGRGKFQDIDILSIAGSTTIFTENVTDNIGIASINFETAKPNEPPIISVPGSYSEQTKIASVSVNYSNFFPTDGHDYHVKFIATDKAGNIATLGRDVGVGSCKSIELPKPVAQFVPGYSGSYAGQAGFQSWSNGGTIYKNPVTVLWRIPNASLAPANKYGIINFSAVHNDGTYSYAITEKPLTHLPNSNNGNWQTYTEWGCVAHDDIQGTLASGVSESPKSLSFDIKLQGQALYENKKYVTTKGNPIIEYITVKAEPRNYVQHVQAIPWDQVPNLGRTYYGGAHTCQIPVGQRSCNLAINQTPTAPSAWIGYPVYISTPDNSISHFAGYAEIIWDAITPQIRNIQYDSITRQGIVGYYSQDYNLLHNNYWWKLDSKILLNRNGALFKEIPLSVSPTNNFEFTSEFDLSTLPTGKYLMSVVASDGAGNKIEKSYGNVMIDHNPPIVEVNLKDGDSINTLDKIIFTIKDNEEPGVKVDSINISGGSTNDNINIGSRNVNGKVYLEYPVLFPSLEENEFYTVTLVASDRQGNKTTKSVKFKYSPSEILLSSGINGQIYIPALTTEFFYKDGSRIIETEPLTLNDGSTVQGNYEVFATIRGSAEVPLMVNGHLVVPGTTVSIIKSHDFSGSNGKLSIPLSAAENGLIGQTDLMISTSAPNSPVLLLDVKTWMGTANLQSAKNEYRQVIDNFEISALPGEGTVCRLTSNEIVAKEADPIKDPVCFIEWTQIPDEAIPTGLKDGGKGALAGLSGHASAVGEHILKYNLSIYNGDGEKYYIGQGSHSISVISAKDAILYEPMLSNLTFKRSIEDVAIRLKQSFGPTCKLTLNASEAIQYAKNTSLGQGLTCLLEWTEFPDGINQDTSYVEPKTKGYINELGEHNLGYKISTYSRLGAKIEVSTQRLPITIENPATPTVSFTSEYHLKDNIYVVPMKGGRLGNLQIQADRGNIVVQTFEGNKIIEQKTYLPNKSRSDDQNILSAVMPFSSSNLFDKIVYKTNIIYSALNDVGIENEYIAYTVPDDGIKPVINVQKQAVSTEILPIQVNIINARNVREMYSVERMGVWKVRLMQQNGKNEEDKPLTDYHLTSNGEVNIDLDISEKGNLRSLKIYAEAVLVHEIPDYERVAVSNRTAFVQILSGDAIDASVSTNRISGQAPFSTTFKLVLDNRLNNSNTGDVLWQISANNGSTWIDQEGNDKQKMQFKTVFDTGEYLVRAITTNKHSGAKYTSEAIEVIAYEGVSIDIKGPSVLFVGSTGKLTAMPYVNRMPTAEELILINEGKLDKSIIDETIPVSYDAVDIQWSTDGGKTFGEKGESIELTSDEVKRFNVIAKIRPINAPEEDKYSYSSNKTSVTFQKVKAPTVRITGDIRVEVGKKHVFSAITSLPYKDFEGEVKGFFTLPNGDIVEKDVIEFEPTIDDMNLGILEFKYTAWIEGYRDQGAETSSVFRTRTWQYIWPNFALDARLDTKFAPATAVLTVRPIGFRGELDQPEYKWSLPGKTQLLAANSPTVRQISINEAGTYQVNLKVTDKRGNSTDLIAEFSINDPLPFKIDLQAIYSNSYLREPLDVRIRPTINGGHPNDRVKSVFYKLNGVPMDSSGMYGKFSQLKAGNYRLDFDIESNMSVKASQNLEFTVKDNKIPICEPLTSKQTVASLIVYAKCKDEDGKISMYNWTVEGEKINVSTNRLVVNLKKGSPIPAINMQAIDDSGALSEMLQLSN